MAAEGPPGEPYPLDSPEACALMDMGREPAFDSIVFTAAQLFRVPMAMLAIVGTRSVWVKASVGPLPKAAAAEQTFCATAVLHDSMLVIEDSMTDNRFNTLQVVLGEPGIRFYAGVPLHDSENKAIATLCVLDRMPRTVPNRARLQLLQLAQEAENLIRRRVAGQNKLS